MCETGGVAEQGFLQTDALLHVQVIAYTSEARMRLCAQAHDHIAWNGVWALFARACKIDFMSILHPAFDDDLEALLFHLQSRPVADIADMFGDFAFALTFVTRCLHLDVETGPQGLQRHDLPFSATMRTSAREASFGSRALAGFAEHFARDFDGS